MPEKKHKYKVGDRVRVKKYEDLKKEKGYPRVGYMSFIAEMRKYCGLTVTIAELTTFRDIDGIKRLGYFIEEEGCTWTDAMFEDIPEGDWEIEIEDGEDWSKKQKPITSIDDVLLIFASYYKCREDGCSCKECPIRDYEENKGNNCDIVLEDAQDFYDEYVAGEKGPSPEVPKEPVAAANCKGNHSCVICEHRKVIDGGFALCTKWHNLTCDDGYCHHFDPHIDFQI